MTIEGLRLFTQSSFTLVFIAFTACALYLALERDRVAPEFRTTIRVSVVYLTIAAINYYYMKDVYASGVAAGTAAFPTQLRYIDWILTTPLMLIKFPLILGIGRRGISFMVRLVVLDVVMIATGYVGEVAHSPAVHYGFFLLGCVAWFGILVSLFIALGTLPDRIGPVVRNGVRIMGLFVVIGWAIYPLGFFAPILGLPDDVRELTYNIADLVNKVGLCLAVYTTAKLQGIDAAEAAEAEEQSEASLEAVEAEAEAA